MDNYQLTICLRVYPGIADKQKVFCDDKMTIFQKSLASLVQSCGNLKTFYYVLLDNCPEAYERITHQFLEGKAYEIIPYASSQGNQKTFSNQIDILLSQQYSEIVYFAEDDYLYLPQSIENFYTVFTNDSADFWTVYHSPDYEKFLIHDHPIYWPEYSDTWYTYRASTTMTFFTKKTSLQYYKNRLLSYAHGNHDFSMWFTITKYNIFNLLKVFQYLLYDFESFKYWGYIRYKCNIHNFLIKKGKLLVPNHSGATHIDKDWMAPWTNRQLIRDAIS